MKNHINAALRHSRIVLAIFLALMAFGIWSLPQMSKDEFPQFTIRQGVIAVIYPGATASEVEQQVTFTLEQFVNSYEEVDKQLTYTITEDGVVYCYVMLRNSVSSMGEAWAKMRAGLELLKKTALPTGVVEAVLIDDFGNTSSILLAIESSERSLRELSELTDELTRQLRDIPEMGRLRVLGAQTEEIQVLIDPLRLAHYHLTPALLEVQLATQGLRTIGGQSDDNTDIRVRLPLSTEYELGEQVLLSDPTTGAVLRLRDIATIRRQYPAPKQWVQYYEPNIDSLTLRHPSEALVISMEMQPGHNIVRFGEDVDRVLHAAEHYLPKDVHLHRVTDQPKVVNDSVRSFLRDIVISILVVVAVMLLLFPLRTALVASTGVPVCTAICIGLMYLCGIELNTVTLAALIFVLGMIVDDSVIVIDGYSNYLEQGWSRWYAANSSTSQLFVPMSLATCAIAGMFFPMTRIITGPLGEFVQLFPFAVLFALGASIFYAAWVTPALSVRFIRPSSDKAQISAFQYAQERFFRALQVFYERLLRYCFNHLWVPLTLLVAALAVGLFFLSQLNLQLLPKAERECFAVEIHLSPATDLKATAFVADSLARLLVREKDVRCVTSFIGHASPRFHATYTPSMASPHYAQFIVGTTNAEATARLLKRLTPIYENYFHDAYIRFKQLDYQAVRNPLEVQLQKRPFASDHTADRAIALLVDSLRQHMSVQPELRWVHSDFDKVSQTIDVSLMPDKASELGITQATLSAFLRIYAQGLSATTIYEEGRNAPTNVRLYLHPDQGSSALTADDIANLLIPSAVGEWVPLRQVAKIQPAWHRTTIEHRNGVPTVTIGADLNGRTSQVDAENSLKRWLALFLQRHPDVNEELEVHYGGLSAINGMMIPQILWSVVAALLVMLVLMLYHFGNVKIALLALSSSLLCLFGAMLGLWLFRMDISITAVLGIVSLIGIIVRNAIMMYEYAEELRHQRKLPVRQAAFDAGLRRMRPVFLTSATTALGVLPMVIAHTSLWMPMGVVICFGTIFTLPLTLTILPVMYWLVNRK